MLTASFAAAATEHILYGFNPNGNGHQPNGGLIADAAGNLYGVTLYGGNYDSGSVYELIHNPDRTWREKVLYSFKSGRDLSGPNGTLTFDAAGNLYGATVGGGFSEFGGVFELTPTAAGPWKETILYVFPSTGNDGYSPNGGLVFDTAGNLYGTTTTQNTGTSVFKLTPKSNGKWTESVVYRFASGNSPNSGVIFDRAGNLYGTVFYGDLGYAGFGYVYELTPSASGWSKTVIYAFTGGADGGNPKGGLVLDPAGNLYGTTNTGGGECSCGTVFELSRQSGGAWQETVLYDFQGGNDGRSPLGDLAFDGAGNLYGVTLAGGTSVFSAGTVFELARGTNGGWDESVLWSFTLAGDGATPEPHVVIGSAGQAYAAASMWGNFQHGTVIELTPTAGGEWSESTINSFSFTDGGVPQTTLIADIGGNMYGTTSTGGVDGCGIVFEMTQSNGGTWKEEVLYNFTADDGCGAHSTLIFDSAGNLYGENAYGGKNQAGSIFELSRHFSGWSEKILYAFDGKVGKIPLGGLIFDPVGNLYGTTQYGGSSACAGGCGIVFELSPGSGNQWNEATLYPFVGSGDGAHPVAGLVFDSAGNLYGTTQHGGQGGHGTVFKMAPGIGGWTETQLHQFTSRPGDGTEPQAGVVLDPTGNIYGTTSEGGNGGGDCVYVGGCGTVFRISPDSGGGWAETVLLNFTGGDGAYPLSTLIMDPSGNLYGTSESGFGGVSGSVFELSAARGGTWTETILYLFPRAVGRNPDGYAPECSLLRDSLGNLYGTTAGGSAHNGGTVFEIRP